MYIFVLTSLKSVHIGICRRQLPVSWQPINWTHPFHAPLLKIWEKRKLCAIFDTGNLSFLDMHPPSSSIIDQWVGTLWWLLRSLLELEVLTGSQMVERLPSLAALLLIYLLLSGNFHIQASSWFPANYYLWWELGILFAFFLFGSLLPCTMIILW